MRLRALAALIVATALSAGCTSAPPHWPQARATAPDPSRWERASCRIDEYPAEIDARALARAHQEDLRARREGAPPPLAAERIGRERAAFDARCATWRAELARM
jgi:hypothetical protein